MRGYDAIVVHYGELWLKGRNRKDFIERLKSNLGNSLSGLGTRIVDSRDRLLIEFSDKRKIEEALGRLRYVFGISWFAPVIASKSTIASIISASERILGKNDTVRIEASRSYKDVPFNSYEIVSHFIKGSRKLGFGIDKDAKKELYISVTKGGTLISADRREGLGGLPVGSSGRAVLLLSGGIDSPVAAFYAMKRGLELSYLHVHAYNSVDAAKKSKIRDLISILSKYGSARAYYAPAYVFQAAAMKIQQKYELVVFRRFLYRLAEKVADGEHATAIVTGESLGQVASQTLANMAASQEGIGKLILRPLIGFDKNEIIRKAMELGTYETSIKPYKDVCSIGVKNPSTKMSGALVSSLYRNCKLDAALNRTAKLTVK